MNRIPTQIRHDYKAMTESDGARRGSRRLPWPIVVAAVGVAAVALMSTLLGAASTARKTGAQAVGDQQSLAGTAQIAVPLPATVHSDPIESEALALPQRPPARQPQPREVDAGIVRQALMLPAPKTPAPAEDVVVVDAQSEIEFVIRPGDTLDELFAAHRLSRADLARLLALQQARRHLQLLKPGDRIAVRHRDGRITSLQRPLDEERTLEIEYGGDGFTASIATNPVERRQARAHGVIESSLFRAAQKAGISDNLIMNLAGIFAWDVDFVLDIRAGDRFVVVYEELWQDGEKLRDGEILAAEFINQGKPFRAIRFTDSSGDSGYFTPEGLNVKKAFLRAPIAISPRVTSSFNPRRLHPVHGKVRPHKGVDYGAPTGTPIKAAGDGKVIFRGRKGGYGNTVILQHGGNITTLYAHMSRFHNRSRVGKRVRQGQIIGYVGATGTVTARHLHYEYRVNGVHRNPRTVKLPKAQPVANAYRADFEAAAAPLLQQLDLVQRSIRLAEGESLD